jgi:DNA-binding protein HU-beta
VNKGGLVAEVSRRTGDRKSDVARVINAAMSVIRESVAKGERVSLVGFGTFARVRRNRRLARNPRRPAETVTIPARDVPAFSPGRPFREEIAAKRRRSTSARRVPARPTSAGRSRTTVKR